MDRFLSDFILNSSFPCIMAKSVLKKGFISFHDVSSTDQSEVCLKHIYQFVDTFRGNSKKLSSLILRFNDPKLLDFEIFEREFWSLLAQMKKIDAQTYAHDPRVNDDPTAADFSYSLKTEAFFILALHPKSPRLARRFHMPTIVMNPHVQFEELRNKGIFKNIQKIIRKKDEILQGKNIMLADYGEESEVFQYIGKVYQSSSPNPLELIA